MEEQKPIVNNRRRMGS